MTVTPAFCPLSLQALLDQNGVPIKGGRIYVYDAQTTNPRQAYRDADLTTAHSNPVLTDGFGRIPVMWLGTGRYKLVLKDAKDAPISVADDIPGAVSDEDTPDPVVGTVIPTGWMMFAYSGDLEDRWLPCNGLTIGAPTSGGTARANADVQDLYLHLWNADPNLAVLGGRGVSGSADWLAQKTIALPTMQGRGPWGVDGMGATAAGVLTSASTPTPNKVGTVLGAQNVQLTQGQLPAITPTITVSQAGGHFHTGNTANSGEHTHTGTTSTDGNHQHDYKDATNATVQREGSASPAYDPPFATNQTSIAGNHNHTITVSGGTHAHALNIDAVGDHSHSASMGALGGGEYHPNMPPVVLGYWHIKI